MEKVEIGVIGGSGLYDIEGLTDVKELEIETPFGKPSDKFVIGMLKGVRIAFLPRHAKGHRILPHEINFRANIYGFKSLGVESIISISAVGSMKENISPGDIVVIDQFFDNTKKRISTFFGNGLVGHVSLAYPICTELSKILYNSGKKLNYKMHWGGTYICIEGPQFSTRGESEIYRKWGVSVIGMTNMPEAKLAREAEICYSTLAMVTDFDCWKETEEAVTVDIVIKTLNENVKKAKMIISAAIQNIRDSETKCCCGKALENALMTNPKLIPEKTKKDLAPIIGKYIK